MLRSVTDLKHATIGATDGEIGDVKDVYFDDQQWTLRYLIVDTGRWLPGRKVLITPLAISGNDWSVPRIDLSLTRDQIQRSPDIDTDKPVSRQHESSYFELYGYPMYWTEPVMWTQLAQPDGADTPTRMDSSTADREATRAQHEREKADPTLRSAANVSGYHVEATDGSIGHVADFLFDEASWALRYFVIDTRNWLPGRHVLISVDWIERVSWRERKAFVNLSRDAIRSSPDYDSEIGLTRDGEVQLYRHYGHDLERSSARGAQIR